MNDGAAQDQTNLKQELRRSLVLGSSRFLPSFSYLPALFLYFEGWSLRTSVTFGCVFTEDIETEFLSFIKKRSQVYSGGLQRLSSSLATFPENYSHCHYVSLTPDCPIRMWSEYNLCICY